MREVFVFKPTLQHPPTWYFPAVFLNEIPQRIKGDGTFQVQMKLNLGNLLKPNQF